jgi:hypothetical protein
MGIAEIITDIMADHSHKVREKRGTGIETAFIEPENGFSDRDDGAGVFVPVEYKRKTNIRRKVAQDKRKPFKARTVPL